MQLIALRRQFRGLLPAINRLAIPVLITELALVLYAQRADAATPVSFVAAEHADSYETVRVYAGRTVPGRVSELSFKQSGQILSITVDLGARVAAGQVLASLDDATLAAVAAQADAEVAVASAGVSAAAARADLARQTTERYAELRASGHVSAQAYDEQALTLRARTAELALAEAALASARAARSAARIALAESHLMAPFGGIVQARHRDHGEQVQSGQPVLRLVETDRVEAHVGIPENVANSLRHGEAFSFRWQQRTLQGRLNALLPEVDPDTRTVTAVFVLQDGDLPLGTLIELELAQRVAAAGYWLPLTALTESDRGLWGIYVINPDDTVERRLVDVVHAEAQRAFVRGTLSSGEQVVSSGVQRLVPGQRVAPQAG